MGDVAEQQQQEAQQEEKPRSKLPYIIVGFVILLGVIIAVSMMVLGGGETDQDFTTVTKTEETGYMFKFTSPFVGNLAPPDDAYLYNADITLEIVPKGDSNEAEALKELGIGDPDNKKNKMPIIEQIINDEFQTKTRIEINSSEGKLKIRFSIKNNLNDKLEYAEVKNVYMKVLVP